MCFSISSRILKKIMLKHFNISLHFRLILFCLIIPFLIRSYIYLIPLPPCFHVSPVLLLPRFLPVPSQLPSYLVSCPFSLSFHLIPLSFSSSFHFIPHFLHSVHLIPILPFIANLLTNF